MAYYGRFEVTIQNSSGTAQSGISVDVRKRGAIVNGTQAATTVLNVFDPGGLVAGDTLQLNGTGTVYTVSTVAATTVTLTAPLGVVDLDILLPDSNVPGTYDDSTGSSTKTNPLTTSASGVAFAYMRGGLYDAYVSGAGITAQIIKDIYVGGFNILSTELTAPAHILDTLRTVASGDKVLSIRNAGTERWYVKGNGTQGATTFEGALTVSTGGITVSATGLTIVSGGIAVQAGGLDIEGDATFRDAILCGPLGTVDCNLYRNSANVWKTDDSLIIAADLTVTGHTLFTVPASAITVSSATLTVPAAGTVFKVTAGSNQTVTAISGATAGQLITFIADAALAAFTITFSGANFSLNAANAILATTTSGTQSGALSFWYDGSLFHLMGNVAT